jgi:S-formylglutathione hydrolase FrmB
MVSIQIGNGGQDAQGAQRGREYDTVSEAYSQFVQREVLPLVESRAGVKLTADPEGRATMGLSSSGAAAFIMAWFNPDLYHRVLAYSPTMVNQQWPWNPALRGGAWEFHSPWTGPATPNLTVKDGALIPSEAPGAPLIPSAPAKPIRYWFEMGDQDLFYPNPTIPDGMHDWTLSAELMAKALTAKGYHYQFLFARNAKHVDRPTIAQTLPSALEWLWKGYPIP